MATVETNLGRVTFVAEGIFNPNKTDYKRLSVVVLDGSSYQATVDNPTGIPQIDGSNPDWQLIAKKGEDGIGAPQTMSQPAIGQLSISNGNTINLNTVNTSGNQTGIAGNKTWAGQHTFSPLSGVGNGLAGLNASGQLTRRELGDLGLVPYTGATQTLNLGNNPLVSSSYLRGAENVLTTNIGRDIVSLRGYTNAPLLSEQTQHWNGSSYVTVYGLKVGFRVGEFNTGSNFTGIGNSVGRYNTGSNFTGIGTLTGQNNTGSNFTGGGYAIGQNNTGSNFTGIGYVTGQNNTGSNFTGVGSNAGRYNTGINNISIGFNSNSGFTPLLVATFGESDVNTADFTINAPSHGLGSANTFNVIRFDLGTGTSSGWTNNNFYQVKVIDANTLAYRWDLGNGQFGGANLSVTGTGHTISKNAINFNNSVAIGYNSNNTKSNQAVIGGTALTEVLFPGVTIASIDAETTGKVGVTKEWVNAQGWLKSADLPTIGNGTLTLATTNGLSGAASFSANQSGSVTFTVGVDSGYKLPTTSEWDSKVDKVVGKGLSDENYSLEEKIKLAGLESSLFKGNYLNLSALETAHPTAPSGSYAYVGSEGIPETIYIWDNTDSEWVSGGSSSSSETPATIKSKYESNADTNAYTNAEKSKLASITAIFTTELKSNYDSASTWASTNGTDVLNHLSATSNPHGVTKAQVGLGNVDNTSDLAKPISTATQAALDNKVDKVAGKVLSTNDFDNDYKDKLDGIASGATVNNTDAYLLNRANHTGTQSVSTITGLGTSAIKNVGTSVGNVVEVQSNGKIDPSLYDVGGAGRQVLLVTANLTLSAGDNGKVLVNDSATQYALTVPNNSTVELPIGFSVDIACPGARITLTIPAGVIMQGLNNDGSNGEVQIGTAANLTKIGTNKWILIGGRDI